MLSPGVGDEGQGTVERRVPCCQTAVAPELTIDLQISMFAKFQRKRLGLCVVRSGQIIDDFSNAFN